MLGTLNLRMSGYPGVGRSVLGALVGAIVAVELYKAGHQIRISTGLAYVPALCTSIAIGRLGCYFNGLSDFTYGTPTDVPWAHDFGDGIPRHPVQLYEALAMLAFLVFTIVSLKNKSSFFRRNGFYLFAGWYGLERYAWEFLKPYGRLLGPFNLFHVASVVLVAYALVMIGRMEHVRARQPA